MRTLYILGLAWLCVGCVDDDFEKRSELFRYRVFGISADQPQPGPEDVVELEALEYVPEGAGPITRKWSVCLLSAGSLTRYACADKRLEFDFYTATPTLRLDLGPGGFLGVGFRAAYAGAQAELDRVRAEDPNARIPELPSLEDGVPIYVKTAFGPAGEPLELGVKTLIVRDGGTPNQNPAVAAIIVPAEVFVGQKVRLTVRVADGSIETYRTSLREDDDRCEADGGEYVCQEELTYGWFANKGEISEAVGFADFKNTQLTVPDEPGVVQVVVTVRDGRGGLHWLRGEIDVLVR